MAKEDSSTLNNGGNGEIMLFGFRVVVDSMRKSVSLNNLSQYEHRLDASSSSIDAVPPPPSAAVSGGYASADDAVAHRSSAAPSRERKRGVPWTEEEHKLFLLGLQKVGKGDWRGISRNFVKSRTPTQVASHAQKYFLRRTNLKSKARRRSSLFDITTTDTTVTVINQSNDHQNSGSKSPKYQHQPQQQQQVFDTNVRFSYPTTTGDDHEMRIVSPISTSNNKKSIEIFDLNNNNDESMSLSLNLSLSMASSSSDLMNSRRDNMISVA